MNVDGARALLRNAAEDEDPVMLPPSVLSKLSVTDLPEDVSIQVGMDKDGVTHLDWEGILRRDGGRIVAEAGQTWTRKYWHEPLGLEQYLDLVRRAVEARQRTRGDVELGAYDDDGAFIHLRFTIFTDEANLERAYTAARKVHAEIGETAHHAVDEVGKQIAEVVARVSGWGAESLDVLLERVAKATQRDEKGRSLEELCARLLEGIPGWSITGRIRTATEEIDISVLNNSEEPRLRREAAIILAECKNWTGKCGKGEFAVFREKMEHRNRRCSLGFLISWNGFTGTVTKAMLRGSREGGLIVPMRGEDLQAAVRDRNFGHVLARCWDQAVHL